MPIPPLKRQYDENCKWQGWIFLGLHSKYIQWNYSGNGTHVKCVHFTSICHIQSNVEVTVNQLYIYSTVPGAAIKCKQYSEITVESWTHVKSVKITLNIFAV